ncbi:HlyD family efflux transporter periplasmic adaptor subunit [Rhodovarius crocodyli]|uniref:HlyD family efflux transporter periplasmic adaptor subunit n=1 Tax=Rhodovarius crocodyli TaxID=1979269 RepID=A0A437M3E9_9PROT|nr:efflux RND transporter periplasmic adaptor subunit [Rhodovarius crocodyli]RVT92228.1 HlyD family efflux transporter periplasmic adaptor subunit [Rhodovarius crocodyli]
MNQALRASLLACTVFLFPGAVMAQGPREILIPMEERQLRPAGIELASPEAEGGQAEIVLPGQVVVPPLQLRVVAAPANGLIEALLVGPDERVNEGQPIARIRSPELVEAQRLYLQAVTAGALAAESLRRDETLFRERVIAERRLLVTRAEAAGASAALEERAQALALVGMSQEAIDELRRTRRISPALTVTAPISGIVLTRQATTGERIAASAAIITVADLSPLWVNIQVPIARANAMRINNRVLLPNPGAEGNIIMIGRSADAATQSVIAVAEITENTELLRPGQALTAMVQLAREGSGGQWRVPAGAVIRHRDRSWVFVRNGEGFYARPVTVLNETAQVTSIRAEFTGQERIAVRGVLSLLSELAQSEES